ncbi:hypothetical protein nbrc107696_44190 [Gordonia spumicola]|uniref:DUF4352 domain-containing protein n=1 Tax=Gordonia spumicola TaxID=589161 RepID=A0A7I9VFT5_9ACTN|nr:DUF4352 domain-containing protein [Gordonia spumicola]GEE03973.1 hypothetical protein nbrc107696_44190 [Gordonia spumicola]
MYPEPAPNQHPPTDPAPATIAMRRGVLVMLTLLVVAGTAAAAGLIGYSIGKDDSADRGVVAITDTAPTSESATSSERETAEPNAIGVPTTNGAMGVTMTKITAPATLDFYDSDYEATKPRAGSRYVLVAIKVTNNGKKPVTPLYAVDVRLVDADGREFSKVEDNYSIRENFSRSEEVPDYLQPGLSTEVYYAFEVPVGAHVVAFGYRDQQSEYDAAWTEYSVDVR